jgi:hypothetical protein
MQEINSRKTTLREHINQCNDLVEEKMAENEKIYEGIRMLEGCLIEIQDLIVR